MKITVELSEKDVKDIMRFTGEKKKGPAIARLVAATLMLKRWRELCDEVASGKVKFTSAGAKSVTLKPSAAVKRALKKAKGSVKVTLGVSLRATGKSAKKSTRVITLASR